MSKEYSSITVVLEENVDKEQLVALMTAIQQMRGVLSVQGAPCDFLAEHIATERVRRELGAKLLDIVFPPATK